jgi:hypothetical protein
VSSNTNGQVTSKAGTVDDGCAPSPEAPTCNFGAAMPGVDGENPYTRFLTASGDDGADGFADNDGVEGPVVGGPVRNFVEVYDVTGGGRTLVGRTAQFTVWAAVAAPGQTPPPDPGPVATAPLQPAQPVATGGKRGGLITARATWQAPGNGGSPITGYTVEAWRVTATGGQVLAKSQNVGASARALTMRGLTRNEQYGFKVKATNVKGTSDPSALSNIVVAR